MTAGSRCVRRLFGATVAFRGAGVLLRLAKVVIAVAVTIVVYRSLHDVLKVMLVVAIPIATGVAWRRLAEQQRYDSDASSPWRLLPIGLLVNTWPAFVIGSGFVQNLHSHPVPTVALSALIVIMVGLFVWDRYVSRPGFRLAERPALEADPRDSPIKQRNVDTVI